MNTFTLSKNGIALTLKKSSLRSLFKEKVYELFHFLFKSDDFCLEAGHLCPKKKVTFERFQFLTSRSFSLGRVFRIPHSVGLRKNSLRGRRKIKKVMIEQKKGEKWKTTYYNIWLSPSLMIFHLKRKWSSSAWQTPGTCGPWTTLPVMLERESVLSFEW